MKVRSKALINYSPSPNSFTSPLYDADPVDDLQLDSYLQGISDLPQVTSDYCDILMAPITIDEIIQETARVKNKISSPGEDGLGYAFLYQLFRYPPLQKLVLKVCNQAHNSSIFPHSWQELRVRLLAKKGDLTNVENWRPISLINCDAKIKSLRSGTSFLPTLGVTTIRVPNGTCELLDWVIFW
ncbi:hypothetical protein RO3G_02145 [Rhizopus delemar RA 99-880]|uniref:Reverse transcriptase domain-containing protein n=1 Tax=Rhizopus delemar (strain RA 99-880 / ATCC MYA-4621 / FGSC 9543 / NRRL 43880) TaxID=246409 RepID=I1BML1_RHIO9|nr:hypothetical protein RO3G_02145 [Rhizopus delemar RA 99-880]|eukprot:EIE77441.1 hypothetical protein RO3G_02145 [Rhizopus delemar RA 99-880]